MGVTLTATRWVRFFRFCVLCRIFVEFLLNTEILKSMRAYLRHFLSRCWSFLFNYLNFKIPVTFDRLTKQSSAGTSKMTSPPTDFVLNARISCQNLFTLQSEVMAKSILSSASDGIVRENTPFCVSGTVSRALDDAQV